MAADAPRFAGSALRGDLSWQDRALCAEVAMDPEMFFPERGGPAKSVKRVCRACPVRAQCLDYAMRHEFPSARHGIWGALTAYEREALAGRLEAAS